MKTFLSIASSVTMVLLAVIVGIARGTEQVSFAILLAGLVIASAIRESTPVVNVVVK